MKINRNDICECGSGKKYKNCCAQSKFGSKWQNNIVRWLVSIGLGIFLIILILGVLDNINSNNLEMEAYKCDNPNCGQIHYRPKTDTN
tara:strand:- start:758 stop:1021 length:264 start_codon:yes stop_codon:yes gene_type:complete